MLEMKLIFLHARKHQSSSFMGMIKYSQSNHSNKFAISSQYLKKEVRDGVHFCMQINIKVSSSQYVIFDGSGQTCSKYPKSEIGDIFAICQEKKILVKFIFCIQRNIKFPIS